MLIGDDAIGDDAIGDGAIGDDAIGDGAIGDGAIGDDAVAAMTERDYDERGVVWLRYLLLTLSFFYIQQKVGTVCVFPSDQPPSQSEAGNMLEFVLADMQKLALSRFRVWFRLLLRTYLSLCFPGKYIGDVSDSCVPDGM